VTHDDEDVRLEVLERVLDAAERARGDDITRDADGEDVARPLVEDVLGGDAAVRAAEDDGEGRLPDDLRAPLDRGVLLAERLPAVVAGVTELQGADGLLGRAGHGLAQPRYLLHRRPALGQLRQLQLIRSQLLGAALGLFMSCVFVRHGASGRSLDTATNLSQCCASKSMSGFSTIS